MRVCWCFRHFFGSSGSPASSQACPDFAGRSYFMDKDVVHFRVRPRFLLMISMRSRSAFFLLIALLSGGLSLHGQRRPSIPSYDPDQSREAMRAEATGWINGRVQDALGRIEGLEAKQAQPLANGLVEHYARFLKIHMQAGKRISEGERRAAMQAERSRLPRYGNAPCRSRGNPFRNPSLNNWAVYSANWSAADRKSLEKVARKGRTDQCF